jgi:Fic family protein
VPAPLPPDPALVKDDELFVIHSKADQALGRLDASADMLPNPDLFVSMYVRKEAVLSSQIEGTQASLADVLEFEASHARRGSRTDVAEIVNYVGAMNYGLERLKNFPLSNRLLREIHGKLLAGVRGSEMTPGEFRTSQNWIGGEHTLLANAAFVPPPPHEMDRAMGQLESYLHSDLAESVLVKSALIHGQFETIHPFLDGNGRMGRLLITFFLCQQGVLQRPLLYLSAYLRQHQQEYYDRLQAVRDSGDWEGWLKFYLTAVWRVAEEAYSAAREIITIRERHREAIQERMTGSTNGIELLDLLYQQPYMSVTMAADLLGVSFPTANGLIHSLEELGVLEEITGQERNRIFRYAPYIRLLDIEAPGS